jgi:hypothetical protein
LPSVKSLINDWDEKKGRLKPNKKSEIYKFYIEYNKIIDESEIQLKIILRHLLLNNIKPTVTEVKNRLVSTIKDMETNTFISGFEEFINKNKSTKVERTTKTYIIVFNFLKEFEKYSNVILQFENLIMNFLKAFEIIHLK